MKSPDQFLAEQPGPTTVWRQGRKVRINVYEGERAVCQCHTVGDAERIVAAVNRVSTVGHLAPATKIPDRGSVRSNNDWPLYAFSAWLSDFVDLYEERPSDDTIDAAYWYWRRDQSPQQAQTTLRQIKTLEAASIAGQVVTRQIEALGLTTVLTGPSVEQMRALWDFVVGERDRLDITCVETIYQTDRVAVAATEFVQGCIDRVGYGKYADEEEEGDA